MMRAALALLLLLVAAPAHAVNSIAFVGDSIHEGGGLAVTSGLYSISRHRQSDTLRALLAKAPAGHAWKDATVKDWTVPASDPTDWSVAPDSTLCSTYRSRYPHLEAACRDRAPLLNYIGSGYDAVLVAFTGSTTPTVSAWADTLVTLKTALDAVNGSILLGTSPYGKTTAQSAAMPADSYRATRVAVEAEMATRGIINGAHNTTGTMPTNSDTMHGRDHAYATEASLWYAALP